MPQTAQIKENKMGTMPVGPLLASMSIPMMLSMMVQALYNIVDSIFVSMISENALTAVSLAFPIQTLMISFAVGLAVGINAFLYLLKHVYFHHIIKIAMQSQGQGIDCFSAGAIYVFCADFVLLQSSQIDTRQLSQIFLSKSAQFSQTL